ncbi:MAG: PQQ-binding-like beta-propeller repeat protein [Alphaproteobacteria bacterium]
MKNSLFITGVMLCVLMGGAGCSHLPEWMGGRKDTTPALPGERLSVLPRNSTIQADPSVQDAPVRLPVPKANDAWPQHTDYFAADTSNLALAGALDNVQSAGVGEGADFEHTLIPRPVVAQDMVFAMDAEGNISAHSAQDISVIRWQSPGVSEEDEPQIIGGGLAFSAGRLYAVSGRGMVVAIDGETGQQLWRKATNIPFRSAPRVEGDKLYAVSIDSQVYAFNTTSGDVVWSQRGIRETAGMLRSVTPAVSRDLVIVPFPSGEIYALSAGDGRELWMDSLATPSRRMAAAIFAGIGGDPVIDGDVVFAVSSSGVFSVFNLVNGQKLWEYPASSLNTPWISGDYAYLLTSDNILVSFMKYNGTVRWATPLPSFEDETDKRDAILWNGPVMADGRLLLAGSNGQLVQVNAADGTLHRQVEMDDENTSAPVIAGGTLYLIDQQANLRALK